MVVVVVVVVVVFFVVFFVVVVVDVVVVVVVVVEVLFVVVVDFVTTFAIEFIPPRITGVESEFKSGDVFMLYLLLLFEYTEFKSSSLIPTITTFTL